MGSCDMFFAPSTSTSVTMTNLTGHPAISINAGFADNLAVGTMITGRNYDGSAILAAGLAFEDLRAPVTRRPVL